LSLSDPVQHGIIHTQSHPDINHRNTEFTLFESNLVKQIEKRL